MFGNFYFFIMATNVCVCILTMSKKLEKFNGDLSP